METKDQILCASLTSALDLLEGNERGGFGTSDMKQWLWGMRHTLAFLNPLDDMLGDDPVAGGMVGPLSIKPANVPVAEGLADDDPRKELPGYPRPGDSFNVDSAHPGFGTPDRYDYDAGPSQRFVVKLSREGVEGESVLPGGQSGRNTSDHWADQARLWLGNERLPLRFETEDVAEHGTTRWVAMPF